MKPELLKTAFKKPIGNSELISKSPVFYMLTFITSAFLLTSV